MPGHRRAFPTAVNYEVVAFGLAGDGFMDGFNKDVV
jgi:hypothetical protein